MVDLFHTPEVLNVFFSYLNRSRVVFHGHHESEISFHYLLAVHGVVNLALVALFFKEMLEDFDSLIAIGLGVS